MEPEKSLKIRSAVLQEYTEELDSVFRMYIEDINPFIVRFEVSKGEFPVEIQNEIRAIYGHLIRATMDDTPEQAKQNIEKMRSHSKRALLDCFKYTSILCSDNYDDFMKRYENIDLTYLENGEFLSRIVSKRDNAVKALQSAKIAETTNISEEKLFELYQDAYIQFEEMNAELKQAEAGADFLQHKATKKEKISKVSLWVGVIGLLVGIIGVVVNFI